MQIDALEAADWPAVRAIYEEGIAGGQSTFETQAPCWEAWDASHLPICRLVARRDGQVLGWAALSPTSKRKCYAGVAEVSIYVRAAARGQGIGKALLEKVIEISGSERHLDLARRHLSGEHGQLAAAGGVRVSHHRQTRTGRQA